MSDAPNMADMFGKMMDMQRKMSETQEALAARTVTAEAGGGMVKVTANVAARLDVSPNPDLSNRSYSQKPYWHLERSRVGASRKVPFEVLVILSKFGIPNLDLTQHFIKTIDQRTDLIV